MEKLLTTKEREKSITRHRKERDKRVCDRIKAVLLFDDGYSYTELSTTLFAEFKSNRTCLETYARICSMQ